MDKKEDTPIGQLTRAQIHLVALEIVMNHNSIVKTMTPGEVHRCQSCGSWIPSGFGSEDMAAAEKRALKLITRIVEGAMKYGGPDRWQDLDE